MSASADILYMFTVYESPRDFPGMFVVRRWAIGPRQFGDPIAPRPDPRPWAIAATLTHARNSLPKGLARLGRSPDDASIVVETWV